MTAGSDAALRILGLFREDEAEAWDLHAFFEIAAGDAPGRREAVLDLVDRLVERGYLESRGSDFYTITGKGRLAAGGGRLEI